MYLNRGQKADCHIQLVPLCRSDDKSVVHCFPAKKLLHSGTSRRCGYRFDNKGNPTHGPEGAALDAKAASKAAKEAEKLRKQRATLEKRLADNPDFLTDLHQELKKLADDLSAHGVS